MMGSLKGKRILVVDDEEMLRDLLKRVFEAEGAEVWVAASGSAALKIGIAKPFDVLITDVRMPGGDGLQLIENLRRQVTLNPLYFVCSGYNDLDESRVESLGLAGIFEKPFNLREMIKELQRCLSDA